MAKNCHKTVPEGWMSFGLFFLGSSMGIHHLQGYQAKGITLSSEGWTSVIENVNFQAVQQWDIWWPAGWQNSHIPSTTKKGNPASGEMELRLFLAQGRVYILSIFMAIQHNFLVRLPSTPSVHLISASSWSPTLPFLSNNVSPPVCCSDQPHQKPRTTLAG